MREVKLRDKSLQIRPDIFRYEFHIFSSELKKCEP